MELKLYIFCNILPSMATRKKYIKIRLWNFIALLIAKKVKGKGFKRDVLGEDLFTLPTGLLLIRRREKKHLKTAFCIHIYIGNKIKLYPWAIGPSQDTRRCRGWTEPRSSLKRFKIQILSLNSIHSIQLKAVHWWECSAYLKFVYLYKYKN